VGLLQNHREELRKSGLSEETIGRAGLYSAPPRQIDDLLGCGCGSPGLVFPYTSLNGTSGAYVRVKLDRAPDPRKRYRAPGKQGNHVYVPPLVAPSTLADPSTPLWLTEGEKKALKACQEGLACIALPGVWSWRTRTGRVDGKSVPVEDLDHIAWQRRTVYVVFDSDLATNPSVRDAEHALAQELRRRGAQPMAIRLPGGPAGEKVGLDDYLCTHSVEALCAIEPTAIRNPDVRAGAVVLEYHELLQRQYAEPPAIIGRGVLPRRGFAVVGGRPKLGKSSLVLNLIHRRAISQPWLGFMTTPGRTLLLQAEIPERELQGRVELQRSVLTTAVPERHVFFVTHRGIKLNRNDGLQTVRKLLELTRADCLWVDPLARFFDGDENSARDVGRLVSAIDGLIQDLGIAVGLVHHTAKPTPDDARHGGLRLRGSSALFAAADSVLLLDRDEDAFTLSFELRHGREPEPMRLSRTDALWFEPAGPSDDLLAVVAIVSTMGLPWKTLVGAVKQDRGCSQSTAERLVRRAQKAGLIGPDLERRYHPTVSDRQASRDGSVSADA
jgi:AAA domain/Domain of unknown function (DUF3854)